MGSKEQKAEKPKQETKKRISEKEGRRFISVSPATRKSMGLLSFDPDGTFHLKGNEWLRIYKIFYDADLVGCPQTTNLKGHVRFTHTIIPNEEYSTYITIFESCETYDEAERLFSNDEKIFLTVPEDSLLDVEEAMRAIMKIGRVRRKDEFTYADALRAKKDFRRECFDEVTDKIGRVLYHGYVTGPAVLIHMPEKLTDYPYKELKNLNYPVFITADYGIRTSLERDDYSRILENMYNIRSEKYENVKPCTFALSVSTICMSVAERDHVMKAIRDIFFKRGMLLMPAFGTEVDVFESMLSLGMIKSSAMFFSCDDLSKAFQEMLCENS